MKKISPKTVQPLLSPFPQHTDHRFRSPPFIIKPHVSPTTCSIMSQIEPHLPSLEDIDKDCRLNFGINPLSFSSLFFRFVCYFCP